MFSAPLICATGPTRSGGRPAPPAMRAANRVWPVGALPPGSRQAQSESPQ